MTFGRTSHLLVVSIGYRVLGVAAGIGGLASAGWAGYIAYGFLTAPPETKSHLFDSDVLLSLVVGFVSWFFGGLRNLEEVIGWFMIGMAVASVFVACVGAGVFVIGVGIGQHALWGRILGIAVAVTVALVDVTTIAFVAIRPSPSLHVLIAGCLVAGATGYTLWVLLRRFERPAV